jgi:Asp-tRNA(Asn)/Glu-tRNA(Gln) amidotransferase A subunit family amidase
MSSITIALIIVLVVIVAAAIAFVVVNRRQALRTRFGEEYERLVATHNDRAAAERELRDRERRHRDFDLRELSDPERTRYTAAWDAIQERFVDMPTESVAQADELVTGLMAARGYPTDGYDQQLADLSVEHAAMLGHYRSAHEIYQRYENRQATTEDLRQALVHYRALFTDLLGGAPDDARDRSGTGAPLKSTARHDP